ncbi:MAG: hypothetical protein ACK53T_20820 [Planctomycetota bacterium]|jgi:hypothetical protein
MVPRCVPLALAFVVLSGCATPGRDEDLVRSLRDEAAARANASAQQGQRVRPMVFSIDAAGAIDEWGCDPGFYNFASGEPVDDTVRACLERAHQKDGHRAIVCVGYDVGPDGTAGEMILKVLRVDGHECEERRPLVQRASVQLPFSRR